MPEPKVKAILGHANAGGGNISGSANRVIGFVQVYWNKRLGQYVEGKNARMFDRSGRLLGRKQEQGVDARGEGRGNAVTSSKIQTMKSMRNAQKQNAANNPVKNADKKTGLKPLGRSRY